MLTKQLILVFDTSPLIVLLDELGMHEELQRLALSATVVIPKQVIEEYGKPTEIGDALVIDAGKTTHRETRTRCWRASYAKHSGLLSTEQR